MQKAVCVRTEVFAATGAARSGIDITVRAAFRVCSFLPTEYAKTASTDTPLLFHWLWMDSARPRSADNALHSLGTTRYATAHLHHLTAAELAANFHQVRPQCSADAPRPLENTS